MKKLFGKNKGEEHNFWMSYTDLMSGFLIIFIIASFVAYKDKNKNIYNPETEKVIQKDLETYDPKKERVISIGNTDPCGSGSNGDITVAINEYNKIKEIQTSIRNIDTNYFEYDETFKRHTLRNISASFNTGSSNINNIPSNQRQRLLAAGRSIQQFVNRAVNQNADVKYILIVEGQASRDDDMLNYELSYARALSLVRFWTRNNIHFDTNCEVIISGSGQFSQFRIQPDNASNRQNQRFVIHIIPKIGALE
jgi:hypothetical protein